MGDFQHKGKVYYNPVDFAMNQIGGTWRIPILWRLRARTMRYSALQKDIPHITQKMLTTQLRALEEDGFIHREVYPMVPPRVEYSLTEKGRRSIDVIDVIRNYGLELMTEAGVGSPG